ncbi:MAG: M1 family metallopeptidase [Fimbriimonadaceae bacterium]|nr:M1 family metallopeptidase [Fimbriimonadaceae bacterium]
MMPFAALPLLLAIQTPPVAKPISGGALKLEQAAYDVLSYDIAIQVDPVNKTIKGTTIMDAKTVIPTASILLDLDDPYTVTKVTDGKIPLRFDRQGNTLRVYFPLSSQPGDPIHTEVTYEGQPRVAKNAPWDGGIMWAKTPSGADWVSVALQGAGADLLFPCKDHPSDRPNHATMRLTVPDPLIAVGPGKLQKTVNNANKTSTFTWFMPLPINNYSLVFNAAPYVLVKDSQRSVAGQTIPIHFYVLPENKDKAPKLIEEQKKYLAFMEKYCGPFPFRTVKCGIVESPHLGMEHSTAIAYGNKYRFNPDGLDWLLLHEFGHEWWANLVSNVDWRDMWIHEGFQSFMDTLYIGQLRGQPAYFAAMKNRKRNVRNLAPVAPREETSSAAYGGDMYDKGALTLHALRYLIGDDAFFRSIRRMAYPTPESEKWTDGRALRSVTTEDFVNIASSEAKQDLRWFFEVYLRRAKLPVLKSEVESGVLKLEWVAPDGLPFPMPIDVVVDGKTVRVPMIRGSGSVSYTGDAPTIDPNGWVLRQ